MKKCFLLPLICISLLPGCVTTYKATVSYPDNVVKLNSYDVILETKESTQIEVTKNSQKHNKFSFEALKTEVVDGYGFQVVEYESPYWSGEVDTHKSAQEMLDKYKTHNNTFLGLIVFPQGIRFESLTNDVTKSAKWGKNGTKMTVESIGNLDETRLKNVNGFVMTDAFSKTGYTFESERTNRTVTNAKTIAGLAYVYLKESANQPQNGNVFFSDIDVYGADVSKRDIPKIISETIKTYAKRGYYNRQLGPYKIDTKKTETSVPLEIIAVEGMPQGMDYIVQNNETESPVLSFVLDKEDRVISFNDNDWAKILRIGVKPQFNSLAVKENKNVQVVFDNGKTTNVEVSYYDLSPIIAAVEREKYLKEKKEREASEERLRIANLGTGFVRFTSNEDNVDVYINDQFAGQIKSGKPFVTELPATTHRFHVKKDFFGAKAISYELEKDEPFAYHFEMVPSGNLAETQGNTRVKQLTGELNVLTSRNDLTILLDGKEFVPPFQIENIAAGRHKLQVTLGNGEKKNIDITVKENEKNVVRLDSYLQ